jgi:hypothetical protein
MNEPRFVVTDRLWAKLEPHLPGQASDSGVTAGDTACFSRRSSGGFAQGRHGAIFRPGSATGTASSGVSVDGRGQVFSRVYSKL